MQLPPAVPESMGILVCNYKITEVEGREREEEREGEEREEEWKGRRGRGRGKRN